MVSLSIGPRPETDKNSVERLTVVIDGKPVESVVVGNPMTIDCVIEKLELLAWKLKVHKGSK